MIKRTLLGAGIALALAQPGWAALFNVNSTQDIPDAAPGDGQCHAVGMPGTCTLRAAIMEANALAGADIVNLAAGQTYRLTRVDEDDTAVSGDLDITASLTVRFFNSGARPVVDVDGGKRGFEIHGGNVTLSGFDIIGANDGNTLNVVEGGAVAVRAGAGTVQLARLRLHGNMAKLGGGLYNAGAATTVLDSELFGNRADGNGTPVLGAAIYNVGALTIDGTSIHANPGNFDDAIFNFDALTLINSTVSGNEGTAIQSHNYSHVTLRNVTIAGNGRWGFIGSLLSTLVMRNTIIANNLVDCEYSLDDEAVVSTNRYNLDSDGSCDLAGGSSNYSATDPLLTPLKLRGGPSPVHWPRPDSPVIDQGHPVIGAIGCEPVDQHLRDRPVDFDGDGTSRCDVGAVELPSDAIFFDSLETVQPVP